MIRLQVVTVCVLIFFERLNLNSYLRRQRTYYHCALHLIQLATRPIKSNRADSSVQRNLYYNIISVDISLTWSFSEIGIPASYQVYTKKKYNLFKFTIIIPVLAVLDKLLL